MNTELLIPNIKNTFICAHRNKATVEDGVWDWHIHDEYELYLCLEGTIVFYVYGSSFTLKKGDIILINEQRPHKTEKKKGS